MKPSEQTKSYRLTLTKGDDRRVVILRGESHLDAQYRAEQDNPGFIAIIAARI